MAHPSDDTPDDVTPSENAPRAADSLINSWQSTDAETSAFDKRGIWAVAIGGALFGVVLGAIAGYLYVPTGDAGAAVIIAIVGAFAGTVGGAGIGFLVGLVGELIAGWLRLDRAVRTSTSGRLDSMAGRIVYGALLGALGSPLVFVPMRSMGFGPQGYLAAFGSGVVLWAVLGAIGGLVDWMVSGFANPSSRRSLTATMFAILKLAMGLALSMPALLLGVFVAYAITEIAKDVAGSIDLTSVLMAIAVLAIPVCGTALAGYIYYRSRKYWPVILILFIINALMATLALFTVIAAI